MPLTTCTLAWGVHLSGVHRMYQIRQMAADCFEKHTPKEKFCFRAEFFSLICKPFTITAGKALWNSDFPL